MENVLISPEGNLLNYSYIEITINIIIAFVIGIIMAVVYRSTHKGLSYSQSFNHTIVFVAVIVAIIMMVIGGSLARAFALVGALSIIRFRTVLKDTKDMAYIFGSLALGMAAGTSNYFLAGVGTFSVSLLAYFLQYTNFCAVYKSEFILRFRFSQNGDSSSYLDIINDMCKNSNLLHMEPSADNQTLSLTYDIILKDDASAKELASRVGKIEDINEVVLIASKNDVDY